LPDWRPPISISGRYKARWSDVEDYVFKPKKGINVEMRQNEMSEMKGRARLDAPVPPARPEELRAEADGGRGSR